MTMQLHLTQAKKNNNLLSKKLTAMAYINRPIIGLSYDEAMRRAEEAEYRIDEYGNRIYPGRHHHHHGGEGVVVSEVESEIISNGGHHHHHYGVPSEIIERREERIVDNAYDPYRRMY